MDDQAIFDALNKVIAELTARKKKCASLGAALEEGKELLGNSYTQTSADLMEKDAELSTALQYLNKATNVLGLQKNVAVQKAAQAKDVDPITLFEDRNTLSAKPKIMRVLFNFGERSSKKDLLPLAQMASNGSKQAIEEALVVLENAGLVEHEVINKKTFCRITTEGRDFVLKNKWILDTPKKTSQPATAPVPSDENLPLKGWGKFFDLFDRHFKGVLTEESCLPLSVVAKELCFEKDTYVGHAINGKQRRESVKFFQWKNNALYPTKGGISAFAAWKKAEEGKIKFYDNKNIFIDRYSFDGKMLSLFKQAADKQGKKIESLETKDVFLNYEQIKKDFGYANSGACRASINKHIKESGKKFGSDRVMFERAKDAQGAKRMLHFTPYGLDVFKGKYAPKDATPT